ncbi:hypothetical protein B4113_2319 [Geobacillus sp. B4113_201601]|nr:hypothetical protein B4113_2319 [Geobacillus sp. B4113_201601]
MPSLFQMKKSFPLALFVRYTKKKEYCRFLSWAGQAARHGQRAEQTEMEGRRERVNP